MVPWSNSFRYFDEADGDYKYVQTQAGEKDFEEHWRPFLVDFTEHLKKKGWLDKTSIAMDERSLDAMQKVIAFVKRYAPGLKITLAGNYHEEIKFDVHDYCFYIDPPIDRNVIDQRVEKDLPTTFYVCCVPARPNTFPLSPPAESTWLGWYAASCGYTGFLRWAYQSWVKDPLHDTRFVRWPAGDCFLVYPGARSSIRFERLREGIQDFEKIRIIKSKLAESGTKTAKRNLERLENILETFTFEIAKQKPCAEIVNAGKKLLLELSRYAGELQK